MAAGKRENNNVRVIDPKTGKTTWTKVPRLKWEKRKEAYKAQREAYRANRNKKYEGRSQMFLKALNLKPREEVAA